MQVQSLGQEDPLDKGMSTHTSILAWWALTISNVITFQVFTFVIIENKITK